MWLYREKSSKKFEIGYLKFDQTNYMKNCSLKQIFIEVDSCGSREEAARRVHYLNGGDSKKYE